ncbi:hypothetical protein EW145_g3123 [Phellinidium pouzarii]|uniref:Cyclin-like domain-containing protein n=1 Tax=Phellinidium pouzarii TaxID=167371 RepID=A0A4S4L883_9AGAM|nr:hypothetical protein EW145_g3123 [Phellinidium pouzarii]
MESSGKIELPSAFEYADTDHLVILIADMLDRLMEHNDKIPLSPEALTRFHSRSPPTINVLDYLRRIVKYANVERTCLLITLHYIDQICARLTHFTLSSLTCHRFIIAAVVVASKALCDAFCTNSHYAKVGGIRVGELNMLERELLSAMDWRLTVRPLLFTFLPSALALSTRACCQSTREVLDAYYVNLIRTHSSGAYVLAPPRPTAATTSLGVSSVESDIDSGHSASTSSSHPADIAMSNEVDRISPQSSAKPVHVTANIPSASATRRQTVPLSFEPSTVLIDRATLSPRPSIGPTFEQNMAFAALRAPPTSIDAEPSSAIKWAASPAYSDSRIKSERSSESSPALLVDGFQCAEGGFVDRLTKSPFVKKRAVEHAVDGSEAGIGEIAHIDSPRPRTRPRTEPEDGRIN